MKVEKLLFIFSILAVAIFAYYAHVVAEVGAGYSAKIVCSATFMAGRDIDNVVDADIGLPFPFFSIIKERNSVTSSTFFGMIKRTANFNPIRNSCTLLSPDTTQSIWETVDYEEEIKTFSAQDHKWPLGDLEATVTPRASVNAENLEKLMDAAFLEPSPITEVRRNTRAAIVIHDGKIIAERYGEGFSASTPLLGWSMTKSILSTLIGMRVQEKKLSLSDNNLLPEWKNDERSEITLDQLLKASSGLEWQEVNNPWSDVSSMLFRSDDYISYAASKPLKHKPGEVWSYSSGTTNILSKILRNSFIDDGGDFAYWKFSKNFFTRLGMNSMVLDTDAQGNYVGSSFAHGTARDWARFGLFALNRGNWMGEQILEESWFDYALSPAPGAPKGEYGGHWWLNAGSKDDPSNRQYSLLPRDSFFAQGYLGQTLAVIPSKNLVVVRLGATHPDSMWNMEGFLNYIVSEVIA